VALEVCSRGERGFSRRDARAVPDVPAPSAARTSPWSSAKATCQMGTPAPASHGGICVEHVVVVRAASRSVRVATKVRSGRSSQETSWLVYPPSYPKVIAVGRWQ